MGSDDRQCYTGDKGGIVGITLHVEAIAYKILFNRRALRRYVQRREIRSLAAQIAGAPGRDRKLPRDEKLAAIVREIERYVHTPAYQRRRAQDRSQLQDYSD
jgi:hypothetical protein